MDAKTFFTGLICLLSVFVQEEPISKVANIKAPEKAQRIELAEAKQRFASSYRYVRQLPRGMKNIYEVDQIIIAFSDLESASDRQTLEHRQKSEMETMKEMGGELVAGIDESKIVSVNSIRYYILKRHFKDEYFYSFVSEKNEYMGIYGTFIFKRDAKEKADRIFDKLLKGISFKKNR